MTLAASGDFLRANDPDVLRRLEAAEADGVAALPAASVDTDTALTADSDVLVPSQKAIKAYVDTNTATAAQGALADTALQSVLAETLVAAPVDAVAASGTITSDTTNVSDADTVTLGNKVYTFKTALTPAEGEVLIGGDSDASLLNLIRAINHTGTPDTDYSCAAAHTQVSAAASVTSNAFAVTALVNGAAANAYDTTTTAAHLSWGALVLEGGVDGTAGAKGDIAIYGTQFYGCTAAATTATSGAWKKLSQASL